MSCEEIINDLEAGEDTNGGAVLPLDNEPVKVLEVVVKQGEVVVVCGAVHQWGVDGLQHRSKSQTA